MLEDLYQEIILDHYRAPKNRAATLEDEDVHVHHSNPLCGDEMDLRIAVARIEEARAQFRIQNADRLPTLDSFGSATRSRSNAAGESTREVTTGQSRAGPIGPMPGGRRRSPRSVAIQRLPDLSRRMVRILLLRRGLLLVV